MTDVTWPGDAPDIVYTSLVKCQHCGTPLFEVRSDGILVFKLKHHGEKHTSMVRLSDLLKLCRPGEKPGT